MITIAIICEYNPFHNGHRRQINMIKEKFREHHTVIVSLMSGNWVQRGEYAVTDKYTRAKAAVLCGADLVLELPYPWSGGSAEYFARGAVNILNGLGDIDYLCFGSESGDLERLCRAAHHITDREYLSELAKGRVETRSSAVSDIRLRGEIYQKLYHEAYPSCPNDVLGLEYLLALQDTASQITPFTIRREGNATATQSRKWYRDGQWDTLREMVPEEIMALYRRTPPLREGLLSEAVLSHLRLCPPHTLQGFDGVSAGLEYRITESAYRSVTLEQFYRMCATKKYTNAKLRRTVLNCLFGISTELLKSRPQYTVLLGANQKGREYLNQHKPENGILLTKPAHYKKYRENELFSLQIAHAHKADSIYALIEGKSGEAYLTHTPYIQ